MELRHGGEPLAVQPLIFRLLARLAREPWEVVSKEELIADLWEGRAVSDSALTRAVSVARRLLRLEGAPDPIRSVYGVGYCLVPGAGRRSGVPADPDPRTKSVPRDRARAGGRFVGRVAELATFDDALELLRAGTGGLHFITGDAGIGKTRLAEELLVRASEKGIATRVGRCAESAGAPSFWPWIQILRTERELRGEHGFRAIAGHGAQRLERMILDLAEDAALPSADFESTNRFAMLDAVSEHLLRAAGESPLFVVLDDLHCADRSSLALLRFLARELGRAPLLVVGSYRDVDLGRSPIARREIAEITRAGAAQLHPLVGFDEREVAIFLGDGLRQGQLVHLLHAKSGGNPLFLAQLVALIGEGRGTGDIPTDVAELPPALRDAIRLQLDGLSGECRRALAAASVIGREFDLELLRRSTESATEVVLRSLDEAVDARVVRPQGAEGARYRFDHVLVRDCLYDSMGTLERSRCHRRVAQELERLHGARPGSHLPAIAHHFRSALPLGQVDEALDYSERAGLHALEQFAYGEAAAQFERALAILEAAKPADERHRCELLLALSEARVRAGDRAGARESCEAAVGIGRRLHLPGVLARAAIALTPGFFSIETALYDEALVELLEEALEANREAEAGLRVRLLGLLATALYWSDDVERRRSLSEEARSLVGPQSDPSTVAHSLYARHRALWGPDNVDERVDLAQRALDITERLNDREATLLHRAMLITDLAERGEVERLDREIDRFREGAAELHQPQSTWMAPMFQAMRALMKGEFAKATTLANEYREQGTKINSEDAENCWAGQTMFASYEQGFADRVLPMLRLHIAAHPQVLLFRAVPAWLAAETGGLDEAQQDLAHFTASGFGSIPRDMNWLGTMLFLALAVGELRDANSASMLLEILGPYSDRYGLLGFGVVFMGSVSGHLGRLAAIAGDWPLAERYFLRGRQMNERIGAIPWAARVLYDHGIELKKQGYAAQGEDLLLLAVRTSKDRGLVHTLRRAEHALAERTAYSFDPN